MNQQYDCITPSSGRNRPLHHRHQHLLLSNCTELKPAPTFCYYLVNDKADINKENSLPLGLEINLKKKKHKYCWPIVLFSTYIHSPPQQLEISYKL